MPPSSLTIVGSAVATMVWSSAASSIPSISPLSTIRICLWVRRPLAGVATVVVKAPPLQGVGWHNPR